VRNHPDVDSPEIQAAFDDVFDQAILFHGFADFMRDYEVFIYATADPRTGIRPGVENIGAQPERDRTHGARVLEPAGQPGVRQAGVHHRGWAGHRWQFAETVRDVAPEEDGCTTVAPWPGHPRS
jgi:hypothetical protein